VVATTEDANEEVDDEAVGGPSASLVVEQLSSRRESTRLDETL
jgi:hypothetical protein